MAEQATRQQWWGVIIRFVVSAVVLMIVSWVSPGFVVKGGFVGALIAAAVIALLGYLAEMLLGERISPQSRGLVGFIVAAVVIYLAQFIIPGLLLVSLAGVDLSSRAHLLVSQLPVGGRVPDEPSRAAGRPPAPAATATLAADGDGHALVGLYHTHTGETYALSDGVARFDGQEGGVVTVGRALAGALAARGIAVVHNTKIHDVPYPRSYLASRETAEEMLRAHPGLVVLLDIHRDAAKTRKQSVVHIDGEPVATILLVVGSGAREPFPTWRENRAFAERLAAALNERYPGLCQGVRVKNGRYNQFLHPHALLVEIGSVENRTEEAVRAAELFAAVLAGMIRQADGQQKTV